MILFFDSSALVKKYISERGSEPVRAMLSSGSRIVVSQITYAECLSAFAKKLRNKEIDKTLQERACNDFLWDWMGFLTIVDVDSKTMTSVGDLVHELRAADAIQLSCAIWVRDLTGLAPGKVGGERLIEFVTTDPPLADVAKKKAFKVINPETDFRA